MNDRREAQPKAPLVFATRSAHKSELLKKLPLCISSSSSSVGRNSALPPSSEKGCGIAPEPVLKHRRLWVRVSAILPEALPIGHVSQQAPCSGPLHLLKVPVHAMMVHGLSWPRRCRMRRRVWGLRFLQPRGSQRCLLLRNLARILGDFSCSGIPCPLSPPLADGAPPRYTHPVRSPAVPLTPTQLATFQAGSRCWGTDNSASQ